MKKTSVFFLVLMVFLLTFPIVASADFGPKPSIEIIVKNPPQTEYYLDLLVDYSRDDSHENIHDKEIYSENMYNILENYNVDGWRPALVTGTKVPIFGKLTGVPDGKDMIHEFSYVGVPDKFKVIIVTSDGETIVSKNVVDRKAFNSTVYFDCETGDLVEKSMVKAYLLQFISTCGITLIIEGLILVLFGFNLKKNWKPFLYINLLTQVLLTLIVFGAMYTSGSFAAILTYIPFEIVILIIETTMFSRYLTQHSKSRRVAFSITANVLSFLLGMIVLRYFPDIL
ncbi:hypothetical protein [Anaerosalibacter sp. Marseille-P3206]|uniref:hypothetical protein n=1 Tax=Anaerosalibacter sp. Marseille-P3206 TaxID=1871005 RepID=UPI000984592E|nr:hypothetical protein [Anaerosalibacter sp. Marseille-P3206]